MSCNMTEPREPVGTSTQTMPGELSEEQQLGIVLANPRIGHMQHPLVYIRMTQVKSRVVDGIFWQHMTW